MRTIPAFLAVLALASAGAASAQEFRLKEVAAVTAVAPAEIAPRTIIFSDHKGDELADPGTGLVRFEDWERARPLQKQLLALHPAYVEPTVNVTLNGVTKPYKKKLHMYVAEARFVLPKAAASIDLRRYATPAVPAEGRPLDPPSRARGRRRDAAEGAGGGLQPPPRPALVRGAGRGLHRLALRPRRQAADGDQAREQARGGGKKIAEAIDFQSELRVLSGAEAAQPALMRLTGLDQPVAGALEQNLFFVNQIMSFGKLLAVFQPHPSDPGKTVVTALMALGVKSDVLEKKKEFERVPVLRNMVPAQVLVGNSSFNTGTSISAGLPKYVRNRIQAIAGILERE